MREVTVLHLLRGVLGGARAYVSNIEEVEVERALSKRPYSDVKLPIFVQQRPFDILLDHPIREL